MILMSATFTPLNFSMVSIKTISGANAVLLLTLLEQSARVHNKKSCCTKVQRKGAYHGYQQCIQSEPQVRDGLLLLLLF